MCILLPAALAPYIAHCLPGTQQAVCLDVHPHKLGLQPMIPLTTTCRRTISSTACRMMSRFRVQLQAAATPSTCRVWLLQKRWTHLKQAGVNHISYSCRVVQRRAVEAKNILRGRREIVATAHAMTLPPMCRMHLNVEQHVCPSIRCVCTGCAKRGRGDKPTAHPIDSRMSHLICAREEQQQVTYEALER